MRTCPRCIRDDLTDADFYGGMHWCKRCVSEYGKAYRAATPEKQRAKAAVQLAKRRGELVPEPCEGCGSDQNVVAHHDDYSRPLDVRWLCRRCHWIEHNVA